MSQYNMSLFNGPISNKQPAGVVTPFWMYQNVKSNMAKPETVGLRAIPKQFGKGPTGSNNPDTVSGGIADVDKMVKDCQRDYKGTRMKYVTPSGTFSYCNDASLICHSRLLCMDLDDICPISEVNPVFYDFLPECYNMATKETDAVEALKQRLINDTRFNTVMAFRSPRGNGLKWWLEIDPERCDHRVWFKGLRNFLMSPEYGLTDEQVDKSCSNPSRACFLSHDPLVYLRNDLIEDFTI